MGGTPTPPDINQQGVNKPSLVTSGQNPTKGPEWSKQQKRAYHRINSLLTYWRAHNYAVLWLCLTSAEKSDPKSLAPHFQRLKQSIERKFGFSRLEHINIRTSEGNGVYHTFLAYKLPNGWRPYRFYIPQAWLSQEWDRIHGAKIVWISRVRKGYKSHKRLSQYCVAQYCAGQTEFVRLSWSWKRSLGGPLVKTWKALIKLRKNVKWALEDWNKLLGGQVIELQYDYTKWIFYPPPALRFEMQLMAQMDLEGNPLKPFNTSGLYYSKLAS